MKNSIPTRFQSISRSSILLVLLMLPLSALAGNWQIQVGAQNGDMAHQALGFLPNEIWIHAGDSITLSWVTDEVHTATLLKTGQVRPPRQVGCPGTNTTPDFSLFDGSACVNSGVLKNGDTYTVVFPATGNFKLVCLAHPNMTAAIHVLPPSGPLPHDQAFYDEQADRERAALFAAANASEHIHSEDGSVALGAGKILGTGGGTQTASVMRFMEATKVIHAGDTVEWTSAEAVTNHTVTFGAEPADLTKPFGAVTTDTDGALHATIGSPSDNVHSGFITQAPQDRIGLAQAPLGVTRFRVTFTVPGVYNYKCSLHDGLGMLGQVIVLP